MKKPRVIKFFQQNRAKEIFNYNSRGCNAERAREKRGPWREIYNAESYFQAAAPCKTRDFTSQAHERPTLSRCCCCCVACSVVLRHALRDLE